MGVVHGLLRAQGEGLNELVALSDGHRLVAPVSQHIVAGDPDQVLVAGESGQVPCHPDENQQSVAGGIAAPVAQCRIKGQVVVQRIVAEMAVDIEKVLDAMNFLKVLPVALLFVLCAGKVLRAGHPPPQFVSQQGVIGRFLGQNLEAVGFHQVEPHALVRWKSLQESERLYTGECEIAKCHVA